MSKRKNTKRRKPDTVVGGSAVLLAARLQTGAGKHSDKRRATRSVERRRAIQDHS